ncbi:hypothetical protein DF3PB_240015 [uncultured Defluviicoccus sp.]|uniref:Uncharacterized protein n=1 Tax=metagenome TaxID=256318 RepID=A0A380TC91_9ZZZZ|nr:hypothetical protein DF3PB_240015 [uncultured Defluviicoccus sp.]
MSNATLHLSLPQPGCCRPLAAARRLNLVNADGTGSAVAKALRPVSSLNRNAFNAALLSSQKAKSRGCGHSYFVPPPPQRATAVRTIRNRHKANTLMNLKQKRERCKFRMLHCSVMVDAWLDEHHGRLTRDRGQALPVLWSVPRWATPACPFRQRVPEGGRASRKTPRALR